jgi:lipoyl(octanoyl) transferase
VDGRKIAALGLRVRRGCCYHGLSLNVNMDLAPFSMINPCGITDLEVTQFADLGIDVPLDTVSVQYRLHLERLLNGHNHE